MTEEAQVLDPLDKFYGAVHLCRTTGTTDEHVTFDIGEGQTALVPREEFATVPEADSEQSLLIDGPIRPGTWRGSRLGAEALEIWDRMRSYAKTGEVIEGEIVGANDGGLIVDIGVRGFVPRSQVDLFRMDDIDHLVGTTSQFKVTQFDERHGEVILSRRKVLEKGRKEERAKLLETLEVGNKYEGVVRNLTDFGAFVDIGGMEGLLHTSNIAWTRVNRASDVFSPGDKIEVIVLDYDPERDKLSLGRKQLLPDPWLEIASQIEEGQKSEGTIVNVAKFGAFVELAAGIEGLVHNSELSWGDRSLTAAKMFEPGQKVEVLIVGIDTDQRRLRLSVKRLEGDPWADLAAKYNTGDRITGKVARFADFGVFVEIAPSVDGLLHASDISWTEGRISNLEERFELGQELELVLLELDPVEGRASLGLKQIDGDPWVDAMEKAVLGEKIEVTVSRIEPFGAFVEIVPGVDGLIHISEMSEERIDSPDEVVKAGATVEALVINVDKAKRRIGLSLKREHLEGAGEAEYHDEGEATTTLGDLLRPVTTEDAE